MLKEYTREIAALSIIVMFGFMLYNNPANPLLIGALITAFATAYGFYLGGSKVGAETAEKNADTLAQQGRKTVQPVVVTNDPSEPVPIVEPK